MKKDIEWLRNKLVYLHKLDMWNWNQCEPNSREQRHFGGCLAAYEKALDFLDELDEPEVLSEYWIEQKSIDTHVDTVNGEIQVTFRLDDLQNLLIPEQELPAVPKHVADWLDDNIERYRTVYSFIISLVEVFGDTVPEKVWTYASENPDTMARAYLDGYTVEEEPPYYALVKGHEVIGDYSILKYWNLDAFDKRMLLGDRYVVRRWVLTKMRKSEWNKFGINDSNADFVKVEDVEE